LGFIKSSWRRSRRKKLDLRRRNELMKLTRERLDKDLHAAAQAQHQVQRRLLLDVVVRERAAVLELLAREDQALLVRGDALLVLDLGLDVLDRVRGLDLERDGLAREGLDEDLHLRGPVVFVFWLVGACGGRKEVKRRGGLGERKREEKKRWKKKEKRVSSRARPGASELTLPPPMKASRGDLSTGTKNERERAERAPNSRKEESKRAKRKTAVQKKKASMSLLSLSLQRALFPSLPRVRFFSSFKAHADGGARPSPSSEAGGQGKKEAEAREG
jgi:hypothetical protein